jgi:hypothetical protein
MAGNSFHVEASLASMFTSFMAGDCLTNNLVLLCNDSHQWGLLCFPCLHQGGVSQQPQTQSGLSACRLFPDFPRLNWWLLFQFSRYSLCKDPTENTISLLMWVMWYHVFHCSSTVCPVPECVQDCFLKLSYCCVMLPLLWKQCICWAIASQLLSLLIKLFWLSADMPQYCDTSPSSRDIGVAYTIVS